MTDTTYVCDNCGAAWNDDNSIAYANPVCASCGALSTEAKVSADE